MHKPVLIKIRIFGSPSCDECRKLKKAFDMYSIEYEFLDANADANDKICDLYRIEELPHTQAYDAGSGSIICEKIGYVSPSSFMISVAESLESKTPKNLIIDGVRPKAVSPIVPTHVYQSGCKGCQNVTETRRPQ